MNDPMEPTYEAPLNQHEPLQPMGMGADQQQRPVQRVTIFFHIFFKALALLIYLLSGLIFSSSYILTFVSVTMLSAIDFWTVKNVSGRLLVGLRWWNYMDDNGNSQWKFESFEDQRFIHPTDSNAFWTALFVTPAVWFLLAIGAVLTFRFMWLLLIVVAGLCSLINVYGYTKCKKNAKQKLTTLGGTVFTRGMQMGAQMLQRFPAGASGA